MTLVALRRESEHRASVEKSIADQLVIAAEMRPKRFRTKWQRTVYDGPTARKDAETAERDRWIQLLANSLRSTDTATSWTTGTTMPSEVTVSSRISSGISAATVPEASSVDGSVVSGSVLFSAAWGAGSTASDQCEEASYAIFDLPCDCSAIH